MESSMRYMANYKAFLFLTVFLVFLFNLSNYSHWNLPLIAILNLLIVISSIITGLLKSFSREMKLVLKIAINYFLFSLAIWYMGGYYNLSYHIYHTFIIISALAFVESSKYGISIYLVSNLFFSYVFISKELDLNVFISYLYFTLGGVIIGSFAKVHYRITRKLDKKLRELEALYKISKIIDTFPKTQVILENIVRIVAETLNIDECLIMLYDEEKDLLKARARYGKLQSEIKNMVFAKGEGISGKVLLTKERVVSSDLTKDKEIKKQLKYDFGLQSCAIIPLVYKDRSIGVLALYSIDKYHFDDDTLELLDMSASRIVNVLENDRLFKEVKIGSITDGLTKLYNYRYFYEVLQKELKTAAQYNYPVYLLMIDIDRFKSFNDTYGHTLGDRILREIGIIIKENIRNDDIAARYGGEEFAIILSNTSGEDANKVADRIRTKVKEIKNNILELNNTDEKITVSIGIACFPFCAKDAKSLVDKADFRMYIGKKEGGDRIIFERNFEHLEVKGYDVG